MQTLTLGNSSTGNVVIDSGSSSITLSDATAISSTLSVTGNTTLTGDLAVNGDDITSDSNLTINAASYTRIGDTASPGSATGDDDLFVEGDLELDGTLYMDGTIDTVFTQGSLVFAGSDGVLTEDNSSLFFDDTNNRLGIGSTSPLTALDVTGSASVSANLSLGGAGTAHTFNILDNGTLNIQRSPGGDAGLATALFVENSGNVGIGTTSPGGRLHVKSDNSSPI